MKESSKNRSNKNSKSRNSRNRNQQKKRTYWILLIVLLIVLAAGIAAAVLLSRQKDTQTSGNASVDPNASAWDDGVESGTPQSIEENILVPGYSGAEMKAGDTTLNLRIGNPEENTCYLQATLELTDGTVLYESGLLEPGTGFEQIELNQTLEAGTYEALVHYQGYSMEEEPQQLNASDSAFTLTVTP